MDPLHQLLKFSVAIGIMLGIVFVISAGAFASWRTAWQYLRVLIGFVACMAIVGVLLTFVIGPG